MVFKRKPRSWGRTLAEAVYPRGGWLRAVWYVAYRLRRLPDPAHKISRGIAAGVFVCFTPFYGLHFLLAAGLAWIIRGNLLASLLATFFGNPLTFPLIASVSVETGYALMNKGGHMPLPKVVSAFSQTSVELWRNFRALFGPERMHWAHLDGFFYDVFLPYLVGGIVPGAVCAVLAYMASRPLIAAYQRARIKRLKTRFAKSREKAARRVGQNT